MTMMEIAHTVSPLADTRARWPARTFDRLTADEARRALYIDFEGGKDQAPVLLGTMRVRGRSPEPIVHQVVVDPTFAPAGPGFRTFHDAIETLVQRAEHKKRRIVAWSEHELEVVRRECNDDPQLVERFERRYSNARRVAERWMNKLHPAEKPASGQLSAYLTLIGYAVPAGAEPGHVGTTIRALRPTLEAGRPLTPVQKAKWSRLLRHNRHDCAGMRQVCLTAASELERADRSRRPVTSVAS